MSLKVGPALVRPSGPLDDQMAPTDWDRQRDVVAARCLRQEATCPDSIDLANDAITALHDALTGRASGLAGHRSPKYFREQLRAIHVMTLEDLAYLAIKAPDALVACVRVLLGPAGHTVAPMEKAAVDLIEAHARFLERAGSFGATGSRTTRDGVVDEQELAELEAESANVDRAKAEMMAAARAALKARGGRA